MRRENQSHESQIIDALTIEAMPAAAMAVVDTGGITDAGIVGDILCARMRQRGIAGLVTGDPPLAIAFCLSLIDRRSQHGGGATPDPATGRRPTGGGHGLP